MGLYEARFTSYRSDSTLLDISSTSEGGMMGVMGKVGEIVGSR